MVCFGEGNAVFTRQWTSCTGTPCLGGSGDHRIADRNRNRRRGKFGVRGGWSAVSAGIAGYQARIFVRDVVSSLGANRIAGLRQPFCGDDRGSSLNSCYEPAIAGPIVGVTIDSVLVRDDTRAAADLDGIVVVLNLDAGCYLRFNGVASEIWNMLSEPRRVGDVFDALSKSHDVDEAILARDVLPFLHQLIERKLAHPVEQARPR